MVIKKRTIKYNNRMGQKTGTSKIWKKVIKKEIITDRKQECQNLNSGNLLAKGLQRKHEEKNYNQTGNMDTNDLPEFISILRW
jgi:hypothetical protein